MGAKYWQVGSPTALKKCSEVIVDSCNEAILGACCAVVPCTYCLELDLYGQATKYGRAPFNGSEWSGTVDGLSFLGYWERRASYPASPTDATNSIGMAFVKLPAGSYEMGSPPGETGRDADEDLETFSIPEDCYLGAVPVTQAQYAAVMGTNPSHFSGSDRPVERVSFADAAAFCAALNALPAEVAAGRTYRIPAEGEWEYGCRAGTTTAYSFGNDSADLPANAWFTSNSSAQTQDVAQKPANPWGFSDMHGNVWEWAHPSRLGGAEGQQVIRGGAWDSVADDCRSANRELEAETTTANNIGFRVIMETPPPEMVGICEFVVEFDGVEVFRKTCYEGPTCRDASDSADVQVDYELGTLRWTKEEFRPLEYRIDPETGCTIYYCGDCECTCEALCAVIKEADGTEVFNGTLPDTAYDCDPPLWSGIIGDYSISLSLGYDTYNRCVIASEIDGVERDAVLASGCKQLSAIIPLPGYRTLEVECKECACDLPPEPGICICGRSLGSAPTLRFASANAMGTIHTITLTYSDNISDGLVCAPVMPCQGYVGRFDGTLALPMGGSRTEGIDFRLVCSLDCSGYCLYWRYDSRFIEGWCRNSSPGSVDCSCPATIIYPADNSSVVFDCTIDPWSYQIPEWVIEEDPTNCE